MGDRGQTNRAGAPAFPAKLYRIMAEDLAWTAQRRSLKRKRLSNPPIGNAPPVLKWRYEPHRQSSSKEAMPSAEIRQFARTVANPLPRAASHLFITEDTMKMHVAGVSLLIMMWGTMCAQTNSDQAPSGTVVEKQHGDTNEVRVARNRRGSADIRAQVQQRRPVPARRSERSYSASPASR